jgi:hypothetical protein
VPSVAETVNAKLLEKSLIFTLAVSKFAGKQMGGYGTGKEGKKTQRD